MDSSYSSFEKKNVRQLSYSEDRTLIKSKTFENISPKDILSSILHAFKFLPKYTIYFFNGNEGVIEGKYIKSTFSTYDILILVSSNLTETEVEYHITPKHAFGKSSMKLIVSEFFASLEEVIERRSLIKDVEFETPKDKT